MVAGLAAGISSSSLWTDSYVSECSSSFTIQFLVFHSTASSTKFFTGSKINQANPRQKNPWDVPVKAQVAAIPQCTGCCEGGLEGCHGMFPCSFPFCWALDWALQPSGLAHYGCSYIAFSSRNLPGGNRWQWPQEQQLFLPLLFKDGFSKMYECGKDIKRVIFYEHNKTGHH